MNGLLRDPDIDLSGFVRLNPNDHSRLWQLDCSWHASVGAFLAPPAPSLASLRSFVALRAEVAY